jgi:hypothetical protein
VTGLYSRAKERSEGGGDGAVNRWKKKVKRSDTAEQGGGEECKIECPMQHGEHNGGSSKAAAEANRRRAWRDLARFPFSGGLDGVSSGHGVREAGAFSTRLPWRHGGVQAGA